MVKKTFQIFDEKIEKLIKLGKPKIAFGLKELDEEILKSLKRGKKYADIILVGPKTIKNIKEFNIVVNNNPEEKIASMLVKDEVDGIIRGTIDDFKTSEIYQELTGEKYNVGLGLLEDPFGRQFFLSPGGNQQGWEKEERFKIAKEIAKFVEEWGIKPKIAVFTGVRHETYLRKKTIRKGIIGVLNKTYEDAEWIVNKLKKQGYEAKNWAIDLNPAVKSGYNIIIPVNGMVGNQIFRVLLLCGGEILFAPRLGLSHCYEDNSRTEKNYESHVKYLVAMINKNKK